MDFLASFFGRAGYLPHGYCFTWTPALLWTMVTADGVIAAAYFSIPIALVSFVRKRGDSSLNWVVWFFSAFIFSCGITHVMDIWTVWRPDYGMQAVAKTVTAAVSLVTAVALWPLIPKALRIPSVERLNSVIAALESEVRQRRSAEDQLSEIQQALAVTLASIGAGFIATDRQGRVTGMNAVAEQVTGWPQAEAKGQSIWQVFDREDRPADYPAMNPVDLMIEQGMTVDTIHRVVAIARDGTRTPVELRAALTHAVDGSVFGLAMVFRDMSAQVKAEAESSRLAAIVESSTDAIIGKTLEGRITSWNRAAEAMFGYRADEAVGQSIQMLIPPERSSEEMRIIANLARGEAVQAFDTLRLAKDGRLIDVSITISPIRDGEGRIVGASKIARDVTSRRLAEESRRRAQRLEAENRQIQEASRLKSQFLANMSHELRTPLNAVIGFADLLQAGTVPMTSPKHAQFLGHIATSGRHLLQLINDVLDLSKVESGKFEFFPEPVNLPLVLKEVEDILHTSIQRKHIAMTVEIDPALGDLHLDVARLKQVLYNYVSNAIKFTAEGGRVRVRAAALGPDHVRIEVEDTGIGIAPGDLPRLFVEFQQLDGGYSKQHQGTGLGLALTRRLIEAQGGRVGVRSTPGVGSVFEVVLNRIHGTDSRRADRNARDGATMRVLVIEDDPHALTRLVDGLTGFGCQVDGATSGEQALGSARDTAYDAITLGLLLPDRGGFGLLEDIRRDGASSDSPVVGVTLPAAAGEAAAFAIADVLGKPLRSDEILSAMARLRRPDAGSARVMVIDDDPMALDLMQATLKSIGIDAICLLDGREALRDLDLHRPDAIILDLMMPGFDGFEVLDALRRLPEWLDVPVFIWTSMILTDEEYAVLAASARAVVNKGGGAISSMLESLQRRAAAAHETSRS